MIVVFGATCPRRIMAGHRDGRFSIAPHDCMPHRISAEPGKKIHHQLETALFKIP